MITRRSVTVDEFLSAATNGGVDTVNRYIIENNGTEGINVVNRLGSTGLMLASLSDTPAHNAIVQALIKAGADVNITTKRGGTALSFAALLGCRNNILLLIAVSGINLTIPNEDGKTAAERANPEIASLITQAIAARTNSAMKPIIETLEKKSIQLTVLDFKIYRAFMQEFQDTGLQSQAHLDLFTNISFLLAKKSLVDDLLGCLDADVKALWESELANGTARLKLHTPKEYISFFGLSWPVPEKVLTENGSHNLLSRVLLKMEQKNGINLTQDEKFSVPTFVGFISDPEAEEILKKNQLWNDEPKLAGLFYHGKMTHRIQFYLIMKAIEKGLLDIGPLTISELIKVLLRVKAGKDNSPLWNYMVDNVSCVFNVIGRNPSTSTHPKPLFDLNYTASISNNIYSGNASDNSFLFGGDPIFLHSYMMTVLRERAPHLSECITKTFCKAFFVIQDIERHTIRHEIKLNQNALLSKKGEIKMLTSASLEIKKVMQRQADVFNVTGNLHLVQPHHIVLKQNTKNKLIKGNKPSHEIWPSDSNITNNTLQFFYRSDGVVQYREIGKRAEKEIGIDIGLSPGQQAAPSLPSYGPLFSRVLGLTENQAQELKRYRTPSPASGSDVD